ncbi:hypothetical protein ACR80S_05700 [Halomonas sp. MA07-2]
MRVLPPVQVLLRVRVLLPGRVLPPVQVLPRVRVRVPVPVPAAGSRG